MANVVIIGGGPGGYEAAMVATQLGGHVTLIERDGVGGAAVLTDVVPSKSLIATAEVMIRVRHSRELGIVPVDPSLNHPREAIKVDLAEINQRLMQLATEQSHDVDDRLRAEGVQIVQGRGRLLNNRVVLAETDEGMRRFPADMILLATGTRPRELPDARPDGERILTWKQLYNLTELPARSKGATASWRSVRSPTPKASA